MDPTGFDVMPDGVLEMVIGHVANNGPYDLLALLPKLKAETDEYRARVERCRARVEEEKRLRLAQIAAMNAYDRQKAQISDFLLRGAQPGQQSFKCEFCLPYCKRVFSQKGLIDHTDTKHKNELYARMNR